MYEHLLVPIDGSELSEHAIQTSLQLARKLGARVTAFVAEDQPPMPTMGSPVSVYTRETKEHLERTKAHAQEVLAHFKTLAEAAGVPFEGRFERTNSVDEAIVRMAETERCDLIVMATHGRGIFGELFFGSHTKNIMSRCKLPLLVLH